MKFKFNKEMAYICLIICVIMPPDIIGSLKALEGIDHSIALVTYIFSAYIIWKSFSSSRWRMIWGDIFVLLVVGTVLMRIIASALNNTLYLTAALHQIVLACFAVWNIYMLKFNFLNIIKAYRVVMGIYLLLNFILRIFIDAGLEKQYLLDRRVWLLGTKNGSTLYMILFILSDLLCLYTYRKKSLLIKTIFLFSCCIIYFIPFSSSTLLLSELSISLLVLMSFFVGKKLKGMIKNLGEIAVAFIFLALISVIIIDSHGNSIMTLVAKIMGKDPTFSGRIAIWNQAMRYFLENPLWGSGMGLSYDVWTNGKIVYSAHNALLSSLSIFGLFTTILWFISIIYVGIQIFKTKKNNIGIVMIACYIGTMLSMITEANDMHICLLVNLIIIYNISRNNKEYMLGAYFKFPKYVKENIGGIMLNDIICNEKS